MISTYTSQYELTCVLYSPGFCERCVWWDRLSLPNSDILHKGHGWCCDVGTLKIIVGSNGCLKIPLQRKINI